MVAKRNAGEKAAEFVRDGMVVGLGTGSTAYWAIMKIGERVKQGLSIRGIPTSERTAELAAQLGIPLISLGQCENVDLTIDGADEIDDRFQLIKGGGGALFREKMVALASRQLVIAADESKKVRTLGAFPLPVEIVPFGWETTVRQLERLGCRAAVRRKGEHPFLTDNGNWIVDCKFGEISRPEVVHDSIKKLTGVVETGLFVDLARTIVIGTDTGTTILTK